MSFRASGRDESMSLEIKPNYETRLIPKDQLVFYDDNVNEMTEQEFAILRTSLGSGKKVPATDPLVVTQLKDKRFLVLGGNQRGRAIVESQNLEVAPCNVWEVKEKDYGAVSLMLNNHGKPNPILMYRMLAKNAEKGLTAAEITENYSSVIPLTRQQVEDYLSLGSLGEQLLDYISRHGKRSADWDGFSVYHFKLLGSFPAEERMNIAKEVCEKKMSSTELRKTLDSRRYVEQVLRGPMYATATESKASATLTNGAAGALIKFASSVEQDYARPRSLGTLERKEPASVVEREMPNNDHDDTVASLDLRRQIKRGHVPTEYAIELPCTVNKKVRHLFKANVVTRKVQQMEYDDETGTFKIKDIRDDMVVFEPLEEYVKHTGKVSL